MFPVLATIDEGWMAALGFLRAYRWQSAVFLLVYLVAAGLGLSNWIHLPLPVWLSGLVLTWGLGAIGLVVLAPVRTSVYRFAVLGDTSRRYWQFDTRTWRVLIVTLIMATVMLVGAIPFAIGLDVLPVLGVRRLFVAIVVAIAFALKYLGFWLNARLAIAPAMAAAGTRQQAMDTSWAYTRWASFRVLGMMLLVYLPMLCIAASFVALAVLFGFPPGSTGAMVLTAMNALTTTVVSAATDLVWAAVTSRLALKLVKAYRQRAADLSKDQLAEG